MRLAKTMIAAALLACAGLPVMAQGQSPDDDLAALKAQLQQLKVNPFPPPRERSAQILVAIVRRMDVSVIDKATIDEIAGLLEDNSDTVRGRNGDRRGPTPDLTASLFGAGYMRVLPTKVLGGNYSFNVLVAGANNRLQGTELEFEPGAGLTDAISGIGADLGKQRRARVIGKERVGAVGPEIEVGGAELADLERHAAFHLIEQPIAGVCSRGPWPVSATWRIAS